MMRILLLCLAITFIALAASAQTSPPPLPELTNLEEFSSRSGTLIQREFTRIGDVAGLRVDVVKVTDLIGRVSAQGVRISANLGPTGPRDSSLIDSDELDTFLRAMALMKTAAFSTTPDNFTDITYHTRGGLAIGAVYAAKKWNPYLRLDRYDPRTSLNIDQNEVETLRDLISQARERIK